MWKSNWRSAVGLMQVGVTVGIFHKSEFELTIYNTMYMNILDE